MKSESPASSPSSPFSSMRVVALSDTPAAALELERTLRDAGAVDVTGIHTLDALHRQVCKGLVDVVVGDVSHDLCNALGAPDVLKKARPQGAAHPMPNLLWLGKSTTGAARAWWDEAAGGRANSRHGKIKLIGGVPVSALRLYGKLLRASGIHVAISHDEGLAGLSDALTALSKIKRVCMAPFVQPACILPTEEEVVEALATGEGLRVVFQPQFNLSSLEIVGCEALVRWRHPRCGDVSPALFVEMAERLGLDLLLFSFVKARAVGMLTRLAGASAEIPVAVNASVRTLCTPALAERVAQRMQQAELLPQLLKIELTEDIVISDLPALGTAVPTLQAKGIPVSLDDFGSSGSTPLVLCKANFNEVKIDAALVHGALRSASARESLRDLANAAVQRNFRLIAEGIETQETVAMLKEIGCNFGQGYFLSAPLEAEAFFQALSAQSIA